MSRSGSIDIALDGRGRMPATVCFVATEHTEHHPYGETTAAETLTDYEITEVQIAETVIDGDALPEKLYDYLIDILYTEGP